MEQDTAWSTGVMTVDPKLCQALINSDSWESADHGADSRYDFYFIRPDNPLYEPLYSEWLDLLPNACRSSMRMTRYNVGDFIGYHNDMGPVGIKSKRRLTIVYQINDPSEYEGGDLVFVDGRRMERKQGAYAIFSSYQYHWVEPVTKGKRYSLGWWIT